MDYLVLYETFFFKKKYKVNLVQLAKRFRRNKVTNTRRREVLEAECADSNFCFLFNRHTTKLKRYFYDFNFLTHLVDVEEMRPNDFDEGQHSTQGQFYHFHFERSGYRAEAVLKNASQQTNDNLYYEYVVGVFLNKYLSIFPCFVETYNLFKLPLDRRESIPYQRNLVNLFRRHLKAARR